MRAHVAVDTQIMRGMNVSAVLTVLRGGTRMSVSELAQQTGLSRQAVTRALAALDASGLVSFSAPDASEARTGRPAQLVRFRAEAGLVVAVSVTPRHVRVVVADLSGTTLTDQDVPMSADDPAQSVTECIRLAMERIGASSEDVWAASVASPGIIDTDLGLVRFIPSLSALEGDVLTTAVARVLQCPVQIDNDLNLATEGELWRGGMQNVSSMVLVEWGDRVGAGLVLNGSLYRGASNDAGDVGFVPVLTADEPMPPERDQRLGPFENWVGSGAIVAAAMAAADGADPALKARLASCDEATGLEIVRDAVLAGSAPAQEAVAVIARRFAAGLLTIRALLDPQLVLIGGPVARFGDLLLDALRDALTDAVLNPPEIQLSSLGDDAIMHGAVHRALTHIEATKFAPHAVTEVIAPSARQETE